MVETEHGREDLARSIVKVITGVLGEGIHSPHAPVFGREEYHQVKKVLDSTFVSSVSDVVGEFEAALASSIEAPFVFATNSGTSALHLALLAVGVTRGDEVIVPSFSFVATANAVSYCGAVPHFVDISAIDYGVQPVALDAHLADICEFKQGRTINRHTGNPITAIIAMHAFGQPCSIVEVAEVAKAWGLPLIEDAAGALGSAVKGRSVGLYGQVGVFSFNGNKIITTGAGGAVVTKDSKVDEYVRHIGSTARHPHRSKIWHDAIGYNYRMPGINASLGVAQLQALPDFLEIKRKLHVRYIEAFASLRGCKLLTEQPNSTSNFWLNSLELTQCSEATVERLIDLAHESNIYIRRAWECLATLPMYKDCPRADLSVVLSKQPFLLNLPSSPYLKCV